jgi:hydroxymethylglutaryl-CoA reductase
LSNLCTERMTMSEFKISVENLAWKTASGKEVAEKVIEAQRFAELDQYRATTHNKGIMNGIDAVAVALG